MYSFMRGSRGSGKGVQTPSNTGPHPLKMAKPSSQQSLLGHHRHASETSKSGAYNFYACKHVSPVCSCSFVLAFAFVVLFIFVFSFVLFVLLVYFILFSLSLSSLILFLLALWRSFLAST